MRFLIIIYNKINGKFNNLFMIIISGYNIIVININILYLWDKKKVQLY